MSHSQFHRTRKTILTHACSSQGTIKEILTEFNEPFRDSEIKRVYPYIELNKRKTYKENKRVYIQGKQKNVYMHMHGRAWPITRHLQLEILTEFNDSFAVSSNKTV